MPIYWWHRLTMQQKSHREIKQSSLPILYPTRYKICTRSEIKCYDAPVIRKIKHRWSELPLSELLLDSAMTGVEGSWGSEGNVILM